MMKILFFSGAMCLSFAGHALTTWIGPATMNAAAYNTAGNWSPSGVPGASEAININTAVTITGAVPIGANNAVSILGSGTLTINTGVTVTTGDLSVTGASGAIVNNGTLNAHNVTYGNTAGAVITNNSTMNFNNLNVGNGTIAGTFTNNGNMAVAVNILVEEGTVNNAGGAVITTAGVSLQNGGTIINSGNLTSSGTTSNAKIDISSGGTFTNQSTGSLTIDIAASSAYALDVSGSFTNTGTVSIGHNPYNSGAQGIIDRNTGNITNTGSITFQIDPANCVVTDNHGASGSFNTVAVTIISGKACGITVLPVKLVSFTGTVDNNCKISLNWKTGEEINNSYFEIQQSVDAVQFTAIGRTASKQLSSGSDYQFVCDAADRGLQYYRLAIVDNNGLRTYSNTVEVNKTCSNTTVSVYPNPVTDDLIVRNITAGTVIRIMNTRGQVVVERTASAVNEKINIRDLSKGLYIIVAVDKNTAQKTTFKIVKR
ncbi:T9SS type A sorting domain-containing protein [Ferruginibacter sp.]